MSVNNAELFSPNLAFFALCGTGAGPANSPPLPGVRFCQYWAVKRSLSGVLFPSGSSDMHPEVLPTQQIPMVSQRVASCEVSLVPYSGFLASLARTLVGSFLLASRGLWHLQECPCHPLAAVAPLQQCLTLRFVGEGPSSKFSPSGGLCLSLEVSAAPFTCYACIL